jgi:hypothetical protein
VRRVCYLIGVKNKPRIKTQMKTSAKEFAQTFYLEWVNNYLTVEKIAEHHGISVEFANALINEGRDVQNKESLFHS